MKYHLQGEKYRGTKDHFDKKTGKHTRGIPDVFEVDVAKYELMPSGWAPGAGPLGPTPDTDTNCTFLSRGVSRKESKETQFGIEKWFVDPKDRALFDAEKHLVANGTVAVFGKGKPTELRVHRCPNGGFQMQMGGGWHAMYDAQKIAVDSSEEARLGGGGAISYSRLLENPRCLLGPMWLVALWFLPQHCTLCGLV